MSAMNALSGESLRTLIRDVLAEELRRVRAERAGATTAPRPKVREEVVSITSDSELAAFIERLLQVTRDGTARTEIEQGRWVFRLGRAAGHTRSGAIPSVAAPASRPAVFDKGLVGERDVDALPDGTAAIRLGRGVRLTPLARDRARQRGIAIERVKA